MHLVVALEEIFDQIQGFLFSISWNIGAEPSSLKLWGNFIRSGCCAWVHLFVHEVLSKVPRQGQWWSAEQDLAVLKWSGVTGAEEQSQQEPMCLGLPTRAPWCSEHKSGLWRKMQNKQMENPIWRYALNKETQRGVHQNFLWRKVTAQGVPCSGDVGQQDSFLKLRKSIYSI